jgi:hypothetical protein
MPKKADPGHTHAPMLGVPSFAGHSDQQLIRLRLSLDRELRRRRIGHTVGDIGERLVIEHFRSMPGLPNLQIAPPGTKNVDALSRDGDRYSIKTVLDAKKTGTVYPDRDDKEKQLFEFLIIARLAEDYSLASVHQMSWALFVEMRKWDRRMSAWYVPISQRMLSRAQALLG